jgi:hypothetical protein
MTCEDYFNAINQIAADLDEQRDDEKSTIYYRALVHIENAKRERTYYTACTILHDYRLNLKKVKLNATGFDSLFQLLYSNNKTLTS